MKHRIAMSILGILFSISIALLEGCATPRPYDPVEYDRTITTTVAATRVAHRCNKPNTTEFWDYYQLLNTESMNMLEHSNNKADAELIRPAVVQLRSLVTDISKRMVFSPHYCYFKLNDIQASSRTISRVLGSTDNISFCQTDLKPRFDKFKASYEENKISSSEYTELVHDLLQLKEVNNAACTQNNRTIMLQDLQLIEQLVPLAGKL